MAALTASKKGPKYLGGGTVLSYPVGASVAVFRGATVCHDGSDGYVAIAPAGSALDVYGIALEEVTGTTAGALSVDVMVGGIWECPITSVALSSVGAIVYADNDNDFTLTSTSNSVFGWMIGITSSGLAIVKAKYPGQPITDTDTT